MENGNEKTSVCSCKEIAVAGEALGTGLRLKARLGILDMKAEREGIRGWPTYSTLDGSILMMEAPMRKAPGGKFFKRATDREGQKQVEVWQGEEESEHTYVKSWVSTR